MVLGSSKQSIKVGSYFNSDDDTGEINIIRSYGNIYWPKSFGGLFDILYQAIKIFIVLLT